MKFVMMEDPTLLKHAQTIFGADLVKRAFVSMVRYDNDRMVIKALTDYLSKTEQLITTPVCQLFDADENIDISVELINGRVLEFSIKDRGYIALITDLDAYSIVNGDQIVPFVQS